MGFDLNAAVERWKTPADPRSKALTVGEQPTKAMHAYRLLSEPHGGGILGGTIPLLHALEEKGVITAPDLLRLTKLFESFRQKSVEIMCKTSVSIQEEALADPDASPTALAVSSLASENAQIVMKDSASDADKIRYNSGTVIAADSAVYSSEAWAVH